MKNRRQTATAPRNGIGLKALLVDTDTISPMIREALDGVPCVRWERVSRMRRLMASPEWPPRGENLVDRILFEHLLGPMRA